MASESVSPTQISSSARREVPVRRRRRGVSEGRPGETLAAYLFLAPYLFVLGVFFVFASLYGLGLSFFRLDIGFSTPQFVGTYYYEQLFKQLFNGANSEFWISMGNIIKFVIVVVIGQTILALLLAMLLQAVSVKARGAFRTIFYLPSVTSSVAVSLIFLWFYNQQGLINYFLSLFGIKGPDWFGNPTFALPAIMILNIWTTAATYMLYFLAGLQDLPRELYEAAEVDGADRFHLFMNITVPLLRPVIFLVVALGTIGSFQMFDQVMFMTNPPGSPLNSTLTPLVEIYNMAFQYNHFGYAAAMSVILFVVIFAVTIVQRRFIDVNN